MSYVFPLPSLDELTHTRSGYLRAMMAYSVLMATIVGAVTFASSDLPFSWPLFLGVVALSGICIVSTKSDEEDTVNTFWTVLGSSLFIGLSMGQLVSALGPVVLAWVFWASSLVIVMSLVGMMVPQTFEEPWGLVSLLVLLLALAAGMEYTVFLYQFGNTSPYQMGLFAWVMVGVFLSLTVLCWRRGMDDVSSHENAILAAGGPIVNGPDLLQALFQVLDRVSRIGDRAPCSDGEEEV